MGSIQDNQVASVPEMQRSLDQETSTELRVTQEEEEMSLEQETQMTFLGSDPGYNRFIASMDITNEMIRNSIGQTLEEIIRISPSAYKEEDLPVRQEMTSKGGRQERGDREASEGYNRDDREASEGYNRDDENRWDSRYNRERRSNRDYEDDPDRREGRDGEDNGSNRSRSGRSVPSNRSEQQLIDVFRSKVQELANYFETDWQSDPEEIRNSFCRQVESLYKQLNTFDSSINFFARPYQFIR